jgi:hypothetical protein
MVRVSGAIVGVSYVTLELRSRLDVAFDVIYGIHQSSINLKN